MSKALNGIVSAIYDYNFTLPPVDQLPSAALNALTAGAHALKNKVNIVVIQKSLASLEKHLNTAGYIPFVSSISGILRITLGNLEIISGLFLIVFNVNEADVKVFDAPVAFIAHGIANIVRGNVESVPFIGNIATFIYDQNGNRFTYKTEGFEGLI